MKICVLVKEVPDAAVEKRLDPSTGRLDRSGETTLNQFDTHAIEAAMQIREGGAVEVDEIVLGVQECEPARLVFLDDVDLDAIDQRQFAPLHSCGRSGAVSSGSLPVCRVTACASPSR